MASTFHASTPLLADGRYWRLGFAGLDEEVRSGSCPLAVEPGRSLALLLVLAHAVAPEGKIQLVLQKVGGTPKAGAPERRWLSALLEARASHGDKTPRFKDSIRRRVQELQQQVNSLPEG